MFKWIIIMCAIAIPAKCTDDFTKLLTKQAKSGLIINPNNIITSIADLVTEETKTVANMFASLPNIPTNLATQLFYGSLTAISKVYREHRSDINAITNLDGDIFYQNASQIIKLHGFEAEEHTLTTGDGYILSLQRIPKKGAPVAFLLHGILDSADTWLINSPDPKKCLAFILSLAGYDVWLGNSRGNKYSTRHATLDPKKVAFWKFSFDEQGNYDLPATIDYILKTTSQKELYYIGHSQGSATFFAMCALRPEYNSKIKVMIALAPVAWTTHTFSLLISAVMALPFSAVGVPETLEAAGFYDVLAYNKSTADISRIACSVDSPTQAICSNILFEFFGDDNNQMNFTRLPVYLAHTPAGASLRQLAHLCQEKYSGRFRRYDHGPAGNLKAYGTSEAPEYDVSKITAPVALFYGNNDYCARLEDDENIINKFPNIIKKYVVPYDKFNHIDFLWALNATTLVYDEILKIFNAY